MVLTVSLIEKHIVSMRNMFRTFLWRTTACTSLPCRSVMYTRSNICRQTTTVQMEKMRIFICLTFESRSLRIVSAFKAILASFTVCLSSDEGGWMETCLIL